jgi:hypothetical protein
VTGGSPGNAASGGAAASVHALRLDRAAVGRLQSALRRPAGRARAQAVELALVRAGITPEQLQVAAATSPGLAAFYEGIRRALAGEGGAVGSVRMWPEPDSAGLSPAGSRYLALSLFAIAIVLGLAVAPRLLLAGHARSEGVRRQLLREAIFIGIAAVAACLLLASLLLRATT